MKKILYFFILIFFIIPNPSWAAEAGKCLENGYSVITINGIFTTESTAKENKENLKKQLPKTYKKEPINIEYIYNPSHLAGIGDIIAVTYQKYWDDDSVSDYDLTEMLNDASRKVNTQKLLLVGHSQGNFYTNSMYDAIMGKKGGVPAESIGVYGVATPSYRVAGGGSWTTSDTDQVISFVRDKLGIYVMPSNVHVSSQEVGISNGHSFSDIYLKYHGEKIISEIQNSLAKLKSNETQKENEPCISPPELTWIHTLAKSALYIADPVSTGLYKTGVAVRDATSKFASSFVKFFTLGNNNAASAILATSEGDSSPDEPVVEDKPKVKKQPQNQDESLNTDLSQSQNIEVTPVPVIEPTPVTQPMFFGGSGYLASTPSPTPSPSPSPVPDTTAPVITITGTNPLTIEKDTVYTDDGATALDDVDGVIAVVVFGTVDTAILGAYIITYTATDAASNVSTTTRTVNVVHTPTTYFDSRSTYAYTPPPVQSGGGRGALWERSTGGAPTAGNINYLHTILVTKTAFNASGTFQFDCMVDNGGPFGYEMLASSPVYNTDDYLTTVESFDFAPYGVDIWKYSKLSFNNLFGGACVFNAGDGVRMRLNGNVLYMGDFSTSTLPQHYMVVANDDLGL